MQKKSLNLEYFVIFEILDFGSIGIPTTNEDDVRIHKIQIFYNVDVMQS